MNDLDFKDLTAEKSLWDIYKKSRGITHTPFNYLATIVFGILIIAGFFLNPFETAKAVEVLRELVKTGFEVSLNVLGFLLAGYTVFTSVCKVELFVEMAKHKKEGYEFSHLKYNMFLFMNTFISFMVFTFYCLLIMLLCNEKGIVTTCVNFMPHKESFKMVLAHVGLFTVGIGLFYIMLSMKSLIFNIYHTVMTSIRWEAENQSKP